MSKGAYFAIVTFCLLLFGGLIWLFFKPTDLEGWVACGVALLINPGMLLGFIACEVDW